MRKPRVYLALRLPGDQQGCTERISIAITGQVKQDKIRDRRRKVNSLVKFGRSEKVGEPLPILATGRISLTSDATVRAASSIVRFGSPSSSRAIEDKRDPTFFHLRYLVERLRAVLKP